MKQRWFREGLYYVAKTNVYRGTEHWTVTKKLFFITYHLLRWIHGDAKLHEMAARVKLP
jgi:hypothetical protein